MIHRARSYVKTKGDCLAQYQAHIHDEWTPLVTAVFERCRNSWHYRIPENTAERAELQQLCVQTLAFENHFLRIYREFLLTALQQVEAAGQWVALEDASSFFEIPAAFLRQQISQGATPSRLVGAQEFVWLDQPYRLKAVKMLSRLIYPADQVIQQSLQELLTNNDLYLSPAASQALTAQKNGC